MSKYLYIQKAIFQLPDNFDGDNISAINNFLGYVSTNSSHQHTEKVDSTELQDLNTMVKLITSIPKEDRALIFYSIAEYVDLRQ
jgi:hypothetical protein